MDTSKERKRTTTEQLEVFLTFLKENPEFKYGKCSQNQPEYLKEKWKELADLMNVVDGPTRTPEQWKGSLLHWKNQVKSRTRKNKMEMLEGGGPSKCIKLTHLEERALSVFGEMNNTTVVEEEKNVPLLEVVIPEKVFTKTEEKDILIDYVTKNHKILFEKDLQSDDIGGNLIELKWEEITEELNKLGLKKTAAQWIKMWTDIRGRLKSKCKQIEKYWLEYNKYPKNVKLTKSEKKILSFSKEYFWVRNIHEDIRNTENNHTKLLKQSEESLELQRRGVSVLENIERNQNIIINLLETLTNKII